MQHSNLHRTITVERKRNACIESRRAERLSVLADRLERTLAHQLIELAPLVWRGDEAERAIDRLRACSLELAIAAAGLRTTAHGDSGGS